MSNDFQISGSNDAALFTMKLHRGEGMVLIAMNWKEGKPPNDFVGFAIEYKEPGGTQFFPLKNRLSFRDAKGNLNPMTLTSRLSPFQTFRWVHFMRNADLTGEYLYRVIPVFMDEEDRLSYGVEQEAAIVLGRETYPGRLNVAFTRGFISSQAFVDRYESAGPISTLLPGKADDGLIFTPTHPKTQEALAWMGFEARRSILELLDEAIADASAKVGIVVYDLNEPEIVSRVESLKGRVRIIIDDDGAHGAKGSAENQAEERLKAAIGTDNVHRQHMGGLQHNKMVVVKGDNVKAAIGGSTNHSWRGFYVQANNAVVLRGESVVNIFFAAFEIIGIIIIRRAILA